MKQPREDPGAALDRLLLVSWRLRPRPGGRPALAHRRFGGWSVRRRFRLVLRGRLCRGNRLCWLFVRHDVQSFLAALDHWTRTMRSPPGCRPCWSLPALRRDRGRRCRRGGRCCLLLLRRLGSTLLSCGMMCRTMGRTCFARCCRLFGEWLPLSRRNRAFGPGQKACLFHGRLDLRPEICGWPRGDRLCSGNCRSGSNRRSGNDGLHGDGIRLLLRRDRRFVLDRALITVRTCKPVGTPVSAAVLTMLRCMRGGGTSWLCRSCSFRATGASLSHRGHTCLLSHGSSLLMVDVPVDVHDVRLLMLRDTGADTGEICLDPLQGRQEHQAQRAPPQVL